jgi:hypothetical protein
MIALLMLFDLADSPVGVADLRAGLPESVERYSRMPGLLQKVYLSNEPGTFGGFYLFESQEALDTALPVLRASSTQRRSGVEPRMLQFKVEAMVGPRLATAPADEAIA